MSLHASKPLPLHGDHAGHANLTSPSVIERLTRFQLTPTIQRGAMMLILVGVVTAIGSAFVQPQLLWASILIVSFLLVSLALSGVLMIALQYLTGAAWSVALRRISEALSGLLIPGLIGIAAVLIFRPSLYPWTTLAEGEHAFTGFKGY